MGARPPGFMQDWSEPRRTRAAQGALGVPPGGAPAGPPMGPGGPVPGQIPGGPMVPAPNQP
ncbi:MAG TPA: response regulator, partial [Planctomycetaceae bacterium]|nr:response regulator [Planctomycetaceae bacterium]